MDAAAGAIHGGKEKMKKLILAAILAAVMLTGCDAGRTGTTVKGGVYPKIMQYGADTGRYIYFYAVDERTGAVYFIFRGENGGSGITVALNADGTPVTKEQLEAWRGDNEHID